nr:MAG TPA: hypothetical protein [Caudoviricetes sp.]
MWFFIRQCFDNFITVLVVQFFEITIRAVETTDFGSSIS